MPSHKRNNSQRVHPELMAKVQELVHAGTTDPVGVQHLLKRAGTTDPVAVQHLLKRAGTTDPVGVQRLLKHHVHHYMCTGNLPNPNDRAYLT